jgi:hypothetical protein
MKYSTGSNFIGVIYASRSYTIYRDHPNGPETIENHPTEHRRQARRTRRRERRSRMRGN